jgi:hypothetical protein
MAQFSDLIGKQLTRIDRGEVDNNDALTFYCDDGSVYQMTHSQDCCESVSIEDITGDLDVLTLSPILKAEETSNRSDTEYGDEQWTFYHIGTVYHTVTIRWYGSSNGYYSTAVYFGKQRTNGSFDIYGYDD